MPEDEGEERREVPRTGDYGPVVEEETVERVWLQLSTEEKVELLRRVLGDLARQFDEHQHGAGGFVLVTPEALSSQLG